MSKKGRGLRIWRFIKRLFLVLFILQFLYIIILKWVDPPITLTQLGSLFTGHGLKRDYVNYNEMSPYAKLAVITGEDQLFADHSGFDWKSIEKAMAYNKRKPNRKPIKGGSTISQQVAKNVFLWQGRSWFRKGLETYFTFMIELIWGKRRILETYLNVAEMGDGVFGIEAAAQHHFKKSARKLTRAEAARITANLPNPKKFSSKKMSGRAAAKYNLIMRQLGHLNADPDVRKIVY